jgi:hypothetical protein
MINSNNRELSIDELVTVNGGRDPDHTIGDRPGGEGRGLGGGGLGGLGGQILGGIKGVVKTIGGFFGF